MWAASCMFQFPSGNTRPNNSAWIPTWKCDRFNMLQPGLFELPFAALKPLMKSQPSRHLLQTLVKHGVHQLLRMSTRRMASCWLPRVHGYIKLCRHMSPMNVLLVISSCWLPVYEYPVYICIHLYTTSLLATLHLLFHEPQNTP